MNNNEPERKRTTNDGDDDGAIHRIIRKNRVTLVE